MVDRLCAAIDCVCNIDDTESINWSTTGSMPAILLYLHKCKCKLDADISSLDITHTSLLNSGRNIERCLYQGLYINYIPGGDPLSSSLFSSLFHSHTLSFSLFLSFPIACGVLEISGPLFIIRWHKRRWPL